MLGVLDSIRTMAIRDKLRQNASQLLQPGEQIQAVFPAQTTSPYLALISVWIILLSNAYRVIVVTDRRLLLCRRSRMRITKVKDVLLQLPRETVIGPAHGLWYQTEALGETLYINRRFHNDVATADSAIGPGLPWIQI